MSNSITLVELTTRQIMTAARLIGGWPPPSSPLFATLRAAYHEVGDERWNPSPADLESLIRLGYVSPGQLPQLEPALRRAISAMLEPTAVAVTCGGTIGSVEAATFFGRGERALDELVLYVCPEPDKLQFAYAYSTQSLLELANRYAAFAAPLAVTRPSIEMTFDEYVILLALIDADRASRLRAMLRREPPPPSCFGSADVQSMLQEGQSHHDLRWMVPLLELAAPFQRGTDDTATQLDDTGIATALEGLSRRGYLIPVASQPGAFGFSTAVAELVESLLTLISFFYLGLHRKTGDAEWESTHFTALRTATTLWVVDYLGVNTPAPAVKMCAIGDREFQEAMSQLLSGGGSAPRLSTCPACGARLSPEDKWCGKCGRDLRPIQPAVDGSR